MRIWTALFLVSWLSAQDAPPMPGLHPPLPALRLKLPLAPREMLKAMVAQDQARRIQPGATVEVIGTDEEAALKLLALTITGQVRLEFRDIDTKQHQELYDFMHQDPSRPTPVLYVPMLPGGKSSRVNDGWLR